LLVFFREVQKVPNLVRREFPWRDFFNIASLSTTLHSSSDSILWGMTWSC
jgi:hypothetical protein